MEMQPRKRMDKGLYIKVDSVTLEMYRELKREYAINYSQLVRNMILHKYQELQKTKTA